MNQVTAFSRGKGRRNRCGAMHGANNAREQTQQGRSTRLHVHFGAPRSAAKTSTIPALLSDDAVPAVERSILSQPPGLLVTSIRPPRRVLPRGPRYGQRFRRACCRWTHIRRCVPPLERVCPRSSRHQKWHGRNGPLVPVHRMLQRIRPPRCRFLVLDGDPVPSHN
jgi:hypothetical protein